MNSFAFHDATAVLAGIVAFGVTGLLVPAIARFAEGRKLVDAPDGARKVHDRAIPRAGGVAVWLGLFAAVLTASVSLVGVSRWLPLEVPPVGADVLLAVLAGLSAAAAIGFLDDLRPIGAPTKLAAQFMAALPIALTVELTGPIDAATGWGPAATGFATACWIVFMMNAVNLLDGLDGLAAGLVVIAGVFLILVGSLTGGVLVLAVALTGSMLAFLRFNMPPARVFMGDTGSLLAGYLLGVVSLAAISMEPTLSRTLGVVVVLGLPVLDTATAVIRRLLNGRPVFHADADHLHHRLLTRSIGLHGRAVFTLYLEAVTLGVFGLLIDSVATPVSIAFSAVVLALGVVFCWDLGYFDGSTYPERSAREATRRLPRTLRDSPPRPVPRAPIGSRASL